MLVNVKNDLEQKNSKVVGGLVLNKINWHSNEKNLHLRFRALIQQNTLNLKYGYSPHSYANAHVIPDQDTS